MDPRRDHTRGSPTAGLGIVIASTSPLSDAGLGVAVRARAPLFPKVAFVLIGFASLLGTPLTNPVLGVPALLLLSRWLSPWSAAAAPGSAGRVRTGDTS